MTLSSTLRTRSPDSDGHERSYWNPCIKLEESGVERIDFILIDNRMYKVLITLQLILSRGIFLLFLVLSLDVSYFMEFLSKPVFTKVHNQSDRGIPPLTCWKDSYLSYRVYEVVVGWEFRNRTCLTSRKGVGLTMTMVSSRVPILSFRGIPTPIRRP